MRRADLRWVWFCAMSCLAALLLVGVGCGDDECLVSGENCTDSYKQNNYGTTDIGCCEGGCHYGGISGVLICQ